MGLAFAYAARRQFREGRSPWGPELRMVLSYELLIVWPIALYLYWVHGDWDLLYRYDPGALPRGTAPALLLLLTVALLAGYLGGRALVRRRGGERNLAWAVAAGTAATVIALVAGRARLFVYGTYAGFRRGDVVPLSETRLPWAIAIALVGAGAAAWLVAIAIASESPRRVRPSRLARTAKAPRERRPQP